MKFRAQVELGGKTATGIAVPGEVVAALAAGKRPAVRATVGGHAYRTTVAPMGGQFDVPLSAENRRAAGVAPGEMVDVDIELDTQPVSSRCGRPRSGGSERQPGERVLRGAVVHAPQGVGVMDRGCQEAETRSTRLERTLVALRVRRRTH